MATEPQGPTVSLCEQHGTHLTDLDGKLTDLDGKLDGVITTTNSIEQSIKGYNGHQGLIPAFEVHCESDRQFREDYYKFKRAVLVTAAFLTGSGILGGGIAGIIKLVSTMA